MFNVLKDSIETNRLNNYNPLNRTLSEYLMLMALMIFIQQKKSFWKIIFHVYESVCEYIYLVLSENIRYSFHIIVEDSNVNNLYSTNKINYIIKTMLEI